MALRISDKVIRLRLLYPGWTLGKISKTAGLSNTTCRYALKKHGLKSANPNGERVGSDSCNFQWAMKKQDIIDMYYKNDATLQSIGDHYGVTRERIRQIMSHMGLKRRSCGARKLHRPENSVLYQIGEG